LLGSGKSSAGYWYFGLIKSGSTAYYKQTGSVGSVTSSSVISYDAWHHLLIARDSADDMKVYLDGNATPIATVATNSSYYITLDYIGVHYNLYDPFEGQVDEFAVWDSDQTSNLSAIYNSGIPADLSSFSPTHWWRMEEGTGTTVADSGTAANNPLSLDNGASFSTTVPYVLPSFTNTLGVLFDGTDDHLKPDNSALATTGDCTISLWFKSASIPGSGAYDYMFSLSDVRSTGKDRAIGIRGTGSDAQLIGNTYGSGWNLPFTNTSIAVNTWYHVVAVFTSGSVQMYLDGVDKGSKSVTTNDPVTLYRYTTIGGMTYSSANYFNGRIDEVAVFHSALSSSDVTAIYNSGVPADLATLNPEGYWRMGDGTGDTDDGGGAPANGDTIGTVVNQGSVSSADAPNQNGALYSNDIP
jgi:hypothetical protein